MNDQVDEKLADSIPLDLQNYLTLDLTADSLIAKDLMNRVSSESGLETIPLSELEGSQPPNITPEMTSWFQMYIGPTRSLALHSVAALFKERCDPARGEGFLAPVRLGSLEEAQLRAKLRTFKEQDEQNAAVSEKIRGLEKQIAEDGHQYDVRKAEIGKDAKVLNRPLYLLVLIFVLFGSEAALNLESFEALPWATPAIAWGATIVVGVAIGLAAHYHGTVFKQYAFYFGASEDDTKRGPAWRMVIGGTLALLSALAFVYYARSAYFVSFVGSVGSFGQSTNGGGFLWIVGGSLLGNILVYLTGMLWAYLMHDPDPDYADLREGLDKAKKRVGKLKQSLESARHRAIEQINATYKRKTEEVQRASRLIMGQQSLSWPQELFKKFQAKDGAVVALLHTYRQLLIQKMGANAKKVRFIAKCDDPHRSTSIMTSDEFSGKAIKLKYLEEA